MDIFENKISKEKFKSTNELWNKLGLNKSWSVGYTTSLIKQKKFKTKEEWYTHYFQSGEDRLAKIKELTEQEFALLKGANVSQNKELNKLNFNYGRTKEEIAQKGTILYNAVLKEGNPYGLTESECKYIAYFRIVCETWNGVIGRENATKDTMIKHFKQKGYEIDVLDTSGDFDYAYGVDFEVAYKGVTVCGLQIKPPSYKANTTYLDKAKQINKIKNDKYKEEFGLNVHYVYASQYGKIDNKEILDTILSEIKNIEK